MPTVFRRIITLFCLALFALAPLRAASAQQGQRLNLIRDAEIENAIRTMVLPIWKAAGLDPNAVEIMIVQDNSLNAFVAGGQRIFINTGLIMRTETPNQLIGVMAHESGHIAGGHLARMQEELRSPHHIADPRDDPGGRRHGGQRRVGRQRRPRRRRRRARLGQGARVAAVVPALHPDPGKRGRPGRDHLPAAHRPVAQGRRSNSCASCRRRSACRSTSAIPT